MVQASVPNKRELVIRIASDEDRDKFNEFVANSPFGSLHQCYDSPEFMSKRGFTRSYRILAERGEEIVATAVLHGKIIPFLCREIIYVPYGPVLNAGDFESLKDIASYIRHLALERGAIDVQIVPSVPSECREFRAILESMGFIRGASNGLEVTLLLDIDKSVDALFKSFKKTCRYNIRFAQKSGVTVRASEDKADLKPFNDMYQETCERSGVNFATPDLFEAVWDTACKQPHIRHQLFLAYYDSKPIAGALVFLFGNKGYYLFGVSSNSHRSMQPNYLIQWTAIQWAKFNGCVYYDFCGVGRKSTRHSKHGRYQFKESFNPAYTEYVGCQDLVLSPLMYRLYTILQRMKKAISAAKKAFRHCLR